MTLPLLLIVLLLPLRVVLLLPPEACVAPLPAAAARVHTQVGRSTGLVQLTPPGWDTQRIHKQRIHSGTVRQDNHTCSRTVAHLLNLDIEPMSP